MIQLDRYCRILSYFQTVLVHYGTIISWSCQSEARLYCYRAEITAALRYLVFHISNDKYTSLFTDSINCRNCLFSHFADSGSRSTSEIWKVAYHFWELNGNRLTQICDIPHIQYRKVIWRNYQLKKPKTFTYYGFYSLPKKAILELFLSRSVLAILSRPWYMYTKWFMVLLYNKLFRQGAILVAATYPTPFVFDKNLPNTEAKISFWRNFHHSLHFDNFQWSQRR